MQCKASKNNYCASTKFVHLLCIKDATTSMINYCASFVLLALQAHPKGQVLEVEWNGRLLCIFDAMQSNQKARSLGCACVASKKEDAQPLPFHSTSSTCPFGALHLHRFCINVIDAQCASKVIGYAPKEHKRAIKKITSLEHKKSKQNKAGQLVLWLKNRYFSKAGY